MSHDVFLPPGANPTPFFSSLLLPFRLSLGSSVLRPPPLPCLQRAPLRPDGGSFPSTRLFNSPPPPPPTTTNDLSPSPSPPRGASSNVRRSVAPSLLAPPFISGQVSHYLQRKMRSHVSPKEMKKATPCNAAPLRRANGHIHIRISSLNFRLPWP